MDMTLCTSNTCPEKDYCYRRRAKPNPNTQRYYNFEYTCNKESSFRDFIRIDEGDILNEDM